MARQQSRAANVRAPYSASTSKGNGKSSGSKSRRKLDPSNAYTFTSTLPKRHRTSEAQLLSAHDEAGPSRPRKRQGGQGDEDGDSDDDMQERIRKVAMMIAEEGPGQVDSEESDVDSDEAWAEGGSDDERWGDVFRDMESAKKKKGQGKAKQAEVVRKPSKPITVNLDESEDEGKAKEKAGKKDAAANGKQKAAIAPISDGEEEDEEDDGDEEEGEEDDEDLDDEVDGESAFGIGSEADDQAAGSGGGEEEEDDDEEDDDEEGDENEDVELPSDLSDDDDEDAAALDDLDAFVDQLVQADKKRKAGDDTEKKEKKRRVLPVVPGPSLPSDGQGNMRSGQKLDIATLLAATPSLAANTKALLPSKARPAEPSSSTSAILKSGVLSAPLPTVVQERLDREAAYEKTREEGQKWSGVMKRIKEAEHLSFPLQATERGGTKSAGDMLASFKPQNDLESAVTRLLTQANLTDDKLTKEEDDALQAQELSIEEIEARRQALRHQRELMFRADVKAKRLSKIKSKTFRKMARKRAAKEGLSLEDLDRLDPEAADAQREKMERARAQERATLKHGASSKFGRNTKGEHGGMFDREDRRAERENMLQRSEELRRRIQGKSANASDDDDDDDEDEDDSEEDDDEDAIREKAFDQMAKLGKKDEAPAFAKGLMGMKFMQNAQDKRMKAVAEEEARVREDIRLFGNPDAGSDDDAGAGDGSDDDEERQPMMIRVGEGRTVWSGPAIASSSGGVPPVPVAHVLSDVSDVRNTGGIQGVRRDVAPATDPEVETSSIPASNPWLVDAGTSGPSRRKQLVPQSAQAKAVQHFEKAAAKQAAKGTSAERGSHVANEEDADAAETDLMPVDGSTPSVQRDLIAEAFAGDNVVDDFVAEKARQVEADAPKVEDTSLKGWGSWGGKGIRKRRTDPRFLVKSAGIEPAARKDAGRANVIISERSERKAAQFLVKDLPYPYTSVAQYEAQFAQPVGSEWNSRSVHQKETLPRVVKKRGAIIEPVRRLF